MAPQACQTNQMACVCGRIFGRHNRMEIGMGTTTIPVKWHRFRAALLGFFMLGFCQVVHSDEGGVPFWMSGQYASLAAVPATPGWSVPVILYNYNGDASASKSFNQGDSVSAGLSARSPLLMIEPTWAPDTKWWGGQPAIGLAFGYGRNSVDADVSIRPSGIEINRTDAIWGWTDLYPVVSVAWNSGVNNWMAYVTGDIPVGSYDPTRMANLGIGHAALDIGGAYTYFNPTSGREFSATAGLTYNWENSDTDYQNGIDWHLDWAVSQFLSEQWEVGVAGYVYYQLTGDSGSGATLGSFKSRVAAIGPEVGYAFNIGKKQAYANIRGYWEFWAKNRLEGVTVFALVSIPL